MSLQLIHLRKLLQLFYAPANLRTSKIREMLRKERDKIAGKKKKDGGDFYVPFWADAKTHMFGHGDLHELTTARIAKNKGYTKLYRIAETGFLSWWNGKRRWRNEPIQPTALPAKARLTIPDLGVVKIENVFGLDSGPDFHRLIYPYFSETPAIAPEAARLGLWAMSQGLAAHHKLEDMRILDVQRGSSFGTLDQALTGDEADIFVRRYAYVTSEWERLRREY